MISVPPHDLEAEAAVLSAALLGADARDVALDELVPEHFYADANRIIFAAIRDVSSDAGRSGLPVDLVTVAAKLRDRQQINQVGGTKYLAQISDATPAVHHVGAHCQIVREKWRLRELIRVCQKTAAEGYGDTGPLQEFFDGAEQAIYELAHIKARSPTVHVSEALTKTFTALQLAAERGDAISGTPTGFSDLDRMIGGLHRGDLAIIAGRPSMGKSAALLNMAVNIASPVVDGAGQIAEPGQGVALFSLEMPTDQLTTRLVCAEARVDLYRVRSNRLSQDDWGALASAAGWLARLPLWLDDTPALSLLELRARIRRIQAEASRRDEPVKLGMVGVDYLQLMKGIRGKDKSREQEVSELSRGLKELAKELDVPVIALSQLNREVERRSSKEKRPILADLRESGAIEQDADTIIFIYRDEYYNPDKTDAKGLAELIVSKQRNGPTGTVKMRWTATCTRFDNLAQQSF